MTTREILAWVLVGVFIGLLLGFWLMRRNETPPDDTEAKTVDIGVYTKGRRTA